MRVYGRYNKALQILVTTMSPINKWNWAECNKNGKSHFISTKIRQWNWIYNEFDCILLEFIFIKKLEENLFWFSVNFEFHLLNYTLNNKTVKVFLYQYTFDGSLSLSLEFHSKYIYLFVVFVCLFIYIYIYVSFFVLTSTSKLRINKI